MLLCRSCKAYLSTVLLASLKQWRQRVSNIGGTFPFPSPRLPSPPFLSPPYPCPSLPTSPSEVGPVNPATGSGGALLAPPAWSGAEPQPKSNLVHFSLKIRHLVASFFNDFNKKSTDRKASSLHSKDNIYYNGSQFMSPGNINICCVSILQTHPLRPTCP